VVNRKKADMKAIIWFVGIIFLISNNAQSQSWAKKTKTKQVIYSNKASKNKPTGKSMGDASTIISLNSVTSYPAKANVNLVSDFKNGYAISDPILTTLDARANGANIRFNNSGIVGMPKRAYGFANGHILLYTTGAVTSGTETGSGLVGTGSSLATFGSIGAPMNVNGKSPYAGINMWGNAMNLSIKSGDSSIGLNQKKRQ